MKLRKEEGGPKKRRSLTKIGNIRANSQNIYIILWAYFLLKISTKGGGGKRKVNILIPKVRGGSEVFHSREKRQMTRKKSN